MITGIEVALRAINEHFILAKKVAPSFPAAGGIGRVIHEIEIKLQSASNLSTHLFAANGREGG